MWRGEVGHGLFVVTSKSRVTLNSCNGSVLKGNGATTAITSMSRQQKQSWCTSLWFDLYLSLVLLLNRFFMVVLPSRTFRTQDVSIADTSCEVILFCPFLFLSLIRCGIRGMKKKKLYAAQLPF